jgi:hypothetical protein
MQRGELAKRAGCNIETVRYYKKTGLLPKGPLRRAVSYTVSFECQNSPGMRRVEARTQDAPRSDEISRRARGGALQTRSYQSRHGQSAP